MNPSDSKAQQEKIYQDGINAGKLIALPVINQLKAKVKEQDREIERLNSDLTQMNLDSMEEELRLKAELADAKKVYTAHATEAEKQIDELQARVKELEEAMREISDLKQTKAQIKAIARFHLLKARGIV